MRNLYQKLAYKLRFFKKYTFKSFFHSFFRGFFRKKQEKWGEITISSINIHKWLNIIHKSDIAKLYFCIAASSIFFEVFIKYLNFSHISTMLKIISCPILKSG